MSLVLGLQAAVDPPTEKKPFLSIEKDFCPVVFMALDAPASFSKGTGHKKGFRFKLKLNQVRNNCRQSEGGKIVPSMSIFTR